MSNWGRVFYSNFLAACPLVFTFINDADEIDALRNMSFGAGVAVFISVALGVGMSYFAWSARSLLSAASFTVVGNTCKVLTIVINVSLWDKHASPFGIACLMFCLVAAYFYQQAPMRAAAKDSDDVVKADDVKDLELAEEKKPILVDKNDGSGR